MIVRHEADRTLVDAAALFVHISAGLAVIVFVAVRLLWRIGDPPPRPEKTPLGAWMDRAGQLAHYALYALLIAVPVVVWILLQRLPYHRVLLAVGGNDATAFSSGVDVTRVRILAYTLGGAFAAVAGIAIATLLQSSDGNAGLEYVLIALAAVALGGTPIGGGRGGLLGAIVGASAIFLVQNLLSALHVDAYWLQVAYGGMLIVGSVIGAQLTAPRRAGTA